MLEVPTEAKPDQSNRLVGSKSLPLFNNVTGTIGIEKYIAFYNKSKPAPANVDSATPPPPPPPEEKHLITSYGFISILMTDDE